MDRGVECNTVFASGNNKEYLTPLFKHWLWSGKEFLLEHFAENHMTQWRTVAKLECHKLCAFFGPPCKTSISAYPEIVLKNNTEVLKNQYIQEIIRMTAALLLLP